MLFINKTISLVMNFTPISKDIKPDKNKRQRYSILRVILVR
jgi:hypothetical protein